MSNFIAFIIAIAFVWILKLFFDAKEKHQKIYEKYKDIIDIEEEVLKFKEELNKTNNEISALKQSYKEKKSIYEKLLEEKMLLEEDLELMSFGIYEPHFDFDTSERYKQQMVKNNEEQKRLIKDKKAIICYSDWAVEGSKAKGRAMTNKQMKLMLRAFNGECDAIMQKVKWNNVDKMEARIKKAFETINKLGDNTNIDITTAYLNSKLEELYLAYEYQQKLQEEKEEQQRIREQIREEEKAQKEFEKAQREAEKEAEHYEMALEQAKKEMEQAKDDEISEYQEKLRAIEQQLKEAQEKKERALSQAQLTKAGHVYVISNIGSFGENVYKIGMTRRLEPLDRVRELGDASVPFKFDIHSMIYSEDAPALECELHNAFKERQVNLVNNRKEFFNVTLDEIKKIVEANLGEIKFTKIAEAQEYRETLALKQRMQAPESFDKVIEDAFPAEI